MVGGLEKDLMRREALFQECKETEKNTSEPVWITFNFLSLTYHPQPT